MVDSIEKPWWRDSLQMFTKLSAWVAGPVIIALVIGKFLDTKYDSEPWFFIGLTAVAFLISMWVIVKETIQYIATAEKTKHD